jgi:hypothetical protein
MISRIKSLGLSLIDCTGIGRDGCSLNMSKVRRLAFEIQNEAKNATTCLCYNNGLNF